jgi:hypothetical protein
VRPKRKPESQSEANEPKQEKSPPVYTDYHQFQLATLLWNAKRAQFDDVETTRLSDLQEKAKAGPLSSLGCFGLFLISIAIGFGSGFGVFCGMAFSSLVLVGMMATAQQGLYRWRHAALLVRREFGDPAPVYGQQSSPPPKQSLRHAIIRPSKSRRLSQRTLVSRSQ